MSLNTQTVSARLKNGNYAVWEVTAEQCGDGDELILSLKNSVQGKNLNDTISKACVFGYSEYGDWPVDRDGRSYCAKDGFPIRIKETDQLEDDDEDLINLLEEERNADENNFRDF